VGKPIRPGKGEVPAAAREWQECSGADVTTPFAVIFGNGLCAATSGGNTAVRRPRERRRRRGGLGRTGRAGRAAADRAAAALPLIGLPPRCR
jgi:hypothetical protein